MQILKFVIAAAATVGISVSAAAQEGPLVSTEWVEKNLNNPKVRIVEVSVEPGQFERGHIPGAQNIAWHTDLVDTVKRDIASKEKFQELVQEARHQQRLHRRSLWRQQQLVRRLGRLDIRHVRREEREAARRRPQEVGSREASHSTTASKRRSLAT